MWSGISLEVGAIVAEVKAVRVLDTSVGSALLGSLELAVLPRMSFNQP